MNELRFRGLAAAVAFCLLALGARAGDAKEGWVRLGERTVNDRGDHDTIAVTGARGDFEALKLAVRGHAVHFLDVKVRFANGRSQDVALRASVPAGGESRVIDLEGKERVITRVDFWYEAQSPRRGQRAVVRLFGRR
jgi:hypothetical protein